MKKILLLIIMLPFLSYGQQSESPTHMYAEIVGTSKLLSKKVSVAIDYGQETKLFSAGKNQIIDKATGKAKVFNSMVDAMNYMASMGWEFLQAYVVTESDISVYHWLMKKELSDNELKEYLPMIRGDIK